MMSRSATTIILLAQKYIQTQPYSVILRVLQSVVRLTDTHSIYPPMLSDQFNLFIYQQVRIRWLRRSGYPTGMMSRSATTTCKLIQDLGVYIDVAVYRPMFSGLFTCLQTVAHSLVKTEWLPTGIVLSSTVKILLLIHIALYGPTLSCQDEPFSDLFCYEQVLTRWLRRSGFPTATLGALAPGGNARLLQSDAEVNTHLLLHLHVYICLSTYWIHPSLYLSIYLSIYPSIYIYI